MLADYVNNLPELNSFYPNWKWSDKDDDTIIIEGLGEFVSELNISSSWPEDLCRRVKIEGKFYYFN